MQTTTKDNLSIDPLIRRCDPLTAHHSIDAGNPSTDVNTHCMEGHACFTPPITMHSSTYSSMYLAMYFSVYFAMYSFSVSCCCHDNEPIYGPNSPVLSFVCCLYANINDITSLTYIRLRILEHYQTLKTSYCKHQVFLYAIASLVRTSVSL